MVIFLNFFIKAYVWLVTCGHSRVRGKHEFSGGWNVDCIKGEVPLSKLHIETVIVLRGINAWIMMFIYSKQS